MCLKVHTFLGLASYYKRFVEGFSSIDRPSTKLSQRNTKFDWDETCEHSFQELKDHLVFTPVLTSPSSIEGKYMVYCDASRKELGFILMQDGKVIALVSRQFKPYEQNYLTHDLKLVVVVFTLKI